MRVQRCMNVLAVALALVSLVACAGGENGPTMEESGKIPVTTSSAEARSSFLQGRQLLEELRIADARRYYADAVKDGLPEWRQVNISEQDDLAKRYNVSSSMVVTTSTNGTPATAAWHRSGAKFSTAPINSPPALLPMIARLSLLVYFSAIK